MNSKRRLSVLVTMLLLAGCDPNPNGPSAPAGSEAGKSQPADTKGKILLMGVSQPIGANGPSPAWPRG
jgi:hypothetical protein